MWIYKNKTILSKKCWQNFLIIKGASQNMTVARRLLSSLNFEFICCVQSSTDFYMSDFWQNYPSPGISKLWPRPVFFVLSILPEILRITFIHGLILLNKTKIVEILRKFFISSVIFESTKKFRPRFENAKSWLFCDN